MAGVKFTVESAERIAAVVEAYEQSHKNSLRERRHLPIFTGGAGKVRIAKLDTPVAGGQPATVAALGDAAATWATFDGGTIADTTRTVSGGVYSRFMLGYAFADEYVMVTRVDDVWAVVSPGHTYVLGTLTTTLTSGGSAAISVIASDTILSGQSVDVRGVWGTPDTDNVLATSGVTIGAVWNQSQGTWDATFETCT